MKNAQQIIKSLKSWEDSDFDATDVFKRKLAERKDVFQKITPLIPSDLDKVPNVKEVNYNELRNNLFMISLIIGVVILFILFVVFIIK